MTISKVIPVGLFRISSNAMRVTDPCYDPDTWCAGTVHNVKNGLWRAFKVMNNSISPNADGLLSLTYGRVCELIVVHSGIEFPIDNFYKEYNQPVEAPFEVGVDSGQAGFYDLDYYLKNNQEEKNASDINSFYGQCCAMNSPYFMGLGEDRGVNELIQHYNAGTMDYGVTSNSGFGDGSYRCFVASDKANEVVYGKIIFIDDVEDENEGD